MFSHEEAESETQEAGVARVAKLQMSAGDMIGNLCVFTLKDYPTMQLFYPI